MPDDIRKDLIFIELKDDLDTNSFLCESDELNEFFHHNSKFNEKNLLSKTYIYYNEKNKEIVGFASLSCNLLKLANSKEFGIQKIPAALLGRIAIDNKYRGYNLGRDLLAYVRGKCNYIKNHIGCRLLIVEVKKSDPILDYFKEYGFEIFHKSKSIHYLGFDLLI